MVRALKNTRATSDTILVKLDIKDFYVVGEHNTLATHVANLFTDPSLRSLVMDVTYFLLSNQYVRMGDELYQILVGAGIGLIHAGDVADAVFFSMLEKEMISKGEFSNAGVIDDD